MARGCRHRAPRGPTKVQQLKARSKGAGSFILNSRATLAKLGRSSALCPKVLRSSTQSSRVFSFTKRDDLQAVCRTKQGVIAQTWSKDGGKSWTALTAAELPNPNSGIDAVTLADGRQLLVYNHSAHRIDEPKGNRYPLDVAISSDGLVWNRVVTLETEPCPSGYSYPAVIQASDGKVHITYSWNRQRIKHVVIDPAKL